MITTIEHNKIKWMHIRKPDARDVEFLRENFAFHELDLEDLVSHQQRPKIDPYDNYTFLVFHFPVMKGGRIEIIEVDFFIGNNYVISSTQDNFQLLEDLFVKMQSDESLKSKFFAKDSRMLFYKVLDDFVEAMLPLMDKFGAEIDSIDSQIFTAHSKHIQSKFIFLEKITILRRNLLITQTIIKPEINIMTEMENGKILFFGNSMATYWSDILDHLKKFSDQLENYRFLIEGLSVAEETLVSYKINEVIKVFTVVTVFLMPPTLLASIYGMNIYLPMQKHPFVFWIMLLLMVAMEIAMFVYFRIKRWF